MIYTQRQISTALALAELDGIAGRIVLCPSELSLVQLDSIISEAKVDVVLSDCPVKFGNFLSVIINAACGLKISADGARPVRNVATEWLLFTSGTSGLPKMVVYTLNALAGPVQDGQGITNSAVWSTFYDIRRYGGLQILLRAFIGGGSMVLSDAGEGTGNFLDRVTANGVTHISGTPSHWRQAMISPSIRKISPGYLRLSGEIADQAILNNLRSVFPAAIITHAFASTEAGVVFDVSDGLAGFPASLLLQPGNSAENGPEIRVIDGSLHIRSFRTATRYAGGTVKTLLDDEGFVDTGDIVEERNGRYYFAGRREGVINVGGLKVHPEEVEAVVNLHPSVQMSRVKGRPSPITGAIVVADIVMQPAYREDDVSIEKITAEIRETCQKMLPPYKVPVTLRNVPSLEMTTAGKLSRRYA